MAPASFLLEKLNKFPESSDDVDSLLQDIVPGVCTRDVTLQEVVEALGSSLTHQRPQEREAGTRFLAGLLEKLPSAYLNPAEASFMVAFLVNRLQDHHAVLPAVFLSCLALVKQERLEDAEVQSLVQGIFREVQVQSHVMSDRRTIYTFLKYCINNRLMALKGLGLSLLPGLVGAVDGEGDPRNLLLVFSLVTSVVRSGLALQPFVEELFEVVAAYFPIEFVPPRNDPYGIQVEDLVLSLRGVLASTPLFAPYCLPLLLEKLDSEIISAKLDSLHTLVACCEVYSAEDLRPHTSPIWVSLRREVLEGVDKAVEEASLSALTAVVRVLEVGLTTSASRAASANLVQAALVECASHLDAPEQRLMWPSTRLLVALVVAAPGPAAAIITRVVPQLAKQCVGQSSTPLAHRNTISAMAMALEAAAKHAHLLLEDGLLKQLAGQVWKSFSLGLSCVEEPQVQATTLASLPAVLPALPTSYLQQAAQELTTLLLDSSSSSSSSSSLREGIRMCLVRLGQHDPKVVLSHTLPPLLDKLHSGVKTASKEEEQVLEILASLTTSKAVLASVLNEVWDQAEALLAEGCLERCHCYLSTVDKMVKGSVKDTESRHFMLEEWKGTQRVLTLFSTLAQQPQSPHHSPAVLYLSSTLRTLMACESKPQPLIQQLVSLAVDVSAESTEVTGPSDTSLLCDTSPEMRRLLAKSLDHTHPSGHSMLHVLEAVIAGSQNLPQEDDSVLQLLRKVRLFSTSTTDPRLREAAVLLHAAAINKLQEGAQLSQAEEEARMDEEEDLDTAQPSEKRLAALHITTWICKALVVRGSDLQQWWTRKLLALLEDPELGVAAARCFETVVKEHPYALQPHCHARTRLLHRQRFFEGVVGPLVETFNCSQGTARASCLVALCSLMPHLPRPVLSQHVDKVLPVVLQGVAGDGGKVVVESVVETLASLLHHTPVPATSHLAFLLPALLTLTFNQPMAVRMKALECLDALAMLPATSLLPYRDDVLRGLKKSLDDHKRVVRRTAANTRSTWVLVGAPEGS